MSFNVPKIVFEKINQNDIEKAVDVLSCCYESNPHYGLIKPYFKPGAVPSGNNDYGDYYWSLDYALAVDGAKWLDFSLGEDLIYNLEAVQEDDGRIKLWSPDVFSEVHGVFTEKIGSLPKFFEVCYSVAEKSPKRELKQKTLKIFEKNLNWWFKCRQDKNTKLISAVFEETFIPNTRSVSMVYAPMDTNIEIYLGCVNASKLALYLGEKEKAEFFDKKAKEIISAVKKYLLNSKDGFYYPYVLTQNKIYNVKQSTGFLGLYAGNEKENDKLIKILKSDEFGFDKFPLTTVSKKDELFTVVEGDYKGNPSWQGSVWTLTNEAVIKALKEKGYKSEAEILANKTVTVFKSNYAEFLNPETGKGQGMLKYAWTASQFIKILIEDIFGISFIDGKVAVNPLTEKDFTVENLSSPNGERFNVKKEKGKVIIWKEK